MASSPRRDAEALLAKGLEARRFDRVSEARRLVTEALLVARTVGEPRALTQTLKGVAQIERDAGNLEAATTLYAEAVSVCRGVPDTRLLAHTVRHLADVLQEGGKLAEALPLYEEALALYGLTESPPPLDIANALRPLAILKEAMGDNRHAERLWEEAMELYGALGIDAGVAEGAARLKRLRGNDESTAC